MQRYGDRKIKPIMSLDVVAMKWFPCLNDKQLKAKNLASEYQRKISLGLRESPDSCLCLELAKHTLGDYNTLELNLNEIRTHSLLKPRIYEKNLRRYKDYLKLSQVYTIKFLCAKYNNLATLPMAEKMVTDCVESLRKTRPGKTVRLDNTMIVAIYYLASVLRYAEVVSKKKLLEDNEINTGLFIKRMELLARHLPDEVEELMSRAPKRKSRKRKRDEIEKEENGENNNNNNDNDDDEGKK
eukprot:TRINITY_DN184_c3_g1_i1.p1 TRINITY_DN184_c3_g1~~TRINITY_DN184_c3_g1_i1.p1  ORF type:complete len:241 (+),score=61.24 TRINITY_DN184_c3_g1_i1:142-864(+)